MKTKTINPLKARNYFLVFFIFCFFSCKEYLDVKPSKSLVIASELKDLQAILDNSSSMNFFATALGEASSDNFYLTDADWNALDDGVRNMYAWGEEIFYDKSSSPWLYYYKAIYYSNFILETLNGIEQTELNKKEWNQIKGSALFFRAFNFYSLVVTFGKAYDAEAAKSDFGIPLRLTSDFNIPSVRANVEDSYQQVVNDLNEAIALLPDRSAHPLRPSKIAVYALFSRIYMAIRNYELANKYAVECLKMDDSLMDYNEVNSSETYPIPMFNDEVLFSTGGTVISLSRMKIDSNLYDSYENLDLRKTIFFALNSDGYSYKFKGSYNNSANPFTGLALDEVYLNRAECLVRFDQYKDGMDVLNRLLIKRYKNTNDGFVELVAENTADALKIILRERRKELVFRDIRWMDIKRLNKEPGNEITLQRKLNGKVLKLLPNDNRYALPLPATVIDLSGMPQNPR